ncbi:SDR family oxidoreductase [Candidatus Gottesmanbacteria bacterium]|nr:SDR family oxidoreductase [Candidatus Gottesmanbacteria bacterium]
MNLKSAKAIVTGSSGGIGRAIALELGKQGTHVGLIARSEDKLQETKKLVEETGGHATIFPLDLRRIEDIYHLAEKLKTEWGHVNILVNVAGIYHDAAKAHYNIPFTKYSTEEIKNTYEVGTNGTTFLTHALLPLMPPRPILSTYPARLKTVRRGGFHILYQSVQ